MHVDLKNLEAQLDDLKARMGKTADLPGWHGVMSRLQRDVTPALIRWRAEEINRGIELEDMRSALILLMVPVILSETTAIFGPEITDDHYEWSNNFFKEFGEQVALAFAGDGAMVEHTVPTVQEGHA